MKAISFLLLTPVVLVALSGCAAEPGSSVGDQGVPTVIVEAIENSRRDSHALDRCDEYGGQAGLVAALDSTADEVRSIAVVPPGETEADLDGLSQDEAVDVVICVGQGRTAEGEHVYVATWLTVDASGIVVIFNADGVTKLGG